MSRPLCRSSGRPPSHVGPRTPTDVKVDAKCRGVRPRAEESLVPRRPQTHASQQRAHGTAPARHPAPPDQGPSTAAPVAKQLLQPRQRPSPRRSCHGHRRLFDILALSAAEAGPYGTNPVPGPPQKHSFPRRAHTAARGRRHTQRSAAEDVHRLVPVPTATRCRSPRGCAAGARMLRRGLSSRQGP